MHASLRMRQYQRQAVASASPEQLIARLYDLGIASCHKDDRTTLRKVLIELTSSLNMDAGGDVAERLASIYEFCLYETPTGDLDVVCELLSGLREAWREGVLKRHAA